MVLLEVDDVHVSIEGAYILQGVSFSVPENEVVVLLGKNGAGKTTTMETIMGISPPTRGSIVLEGEDIAGLPSHEISKKGISYVPDSARIFENLTVEENLKMGMLKGGIDEGKFEEVFEVFSFLKDYMSHKGGALSGGEQKMLALARGMIYGEDKLLLIDEPTEGLSPENSRKTFDALREAKEGTSVILVTGNFKMAKDIGDRYVIMADGKVVDRGDMDELSRDSEAVKEHLEV